MLESCGEDGWDGENARALSKEVVRIARLIDGRVYALYRKIQPHISPGIDGTIGFEFHNQVGTIRKLFIEARPDGTARAYFVTVDNEFEKFPPDSALVVLDSLAPVIEKLSREVKGVG